MKIVSINVVKPGDVLLKKTRDTQKNRNVETIIEALTKDKSGDDLIINGNDVKKFERYAMQKALHKRGIKVLLQNGISRVTQKPVMVIHRMTDKEWKEYVAG